jgi:hypothetical protein
MGRRSVPLLISAVLLSAVGCGSAAPPVGPTRATAASTIATATAHVWQGAITTCIPPATGCLSSIDAFVLRLASDTSGLVQIDHPPATAIVLTGSRRTDGLLRLHGSIPIDLSRTRTVDVQLSSIQPLQGSISFADGAQVGGGAIVFAREIQVFSPGRFSGEWRGETQQVSCTGDCFDRDAIGVMLLTLSDDTRTATGSFSGGPISGLLITGTVTGSTSALSGHYEVTGVCPVQSFGDVTCSSEAELTASAGTLDQLDGTINVRHQFHTESSGVLRSYSASYRMLGVARWP